MTTQTPLEKIKGALDRAKLMFEIYAQIHTDKIKNAANASEAHLFRDKADKNTGLSTLMDEALTTLTELQKDFVMVPREPTGAIMKAMSDCDSDAPWRVIYTAAIAAADTYTPPETHKENDNG